MIDSLVRLTSRGQMISKIPVSLRQYVRDFTVHDYWAIHLNNTVMLAVHPNINLWTMQVTLHEVTHALDALDVDTLTTALSQYSSTQKWHDSYFADISVPSVGANSNWAENFADQAPRAFYDMYVPGGLESIQPNWKEVGQ